MVIVATKVLMLRSNRVATRRQSLKRQNMGLTMLRWRWIRRSCSFGTLRLTLTGWQARRHDRSAMSARRYCRSLCPRPDSPSAARHRSPAGPPLRRVYRRVSAGRHGDGPSRRRWHGAWCSCPPLVMPITRAKAPRLRQQ